MTFSSRWRSTVSAIAFVVGRRVGIVQASHVAFARQARPVGTCVLVARRTRAADPALTAVARARNRVRWIIGADGAVLTNCPAFVGRRWQRRVEPLDEGCDVAQRRAAAAELHDPILCPDRATANAEQLGASVSLGDEGSDYIGTAHAGVC